MKILDTQVGRPPKRFSFKTSGLLASLGRRTGVARIFGFNFSGFFAQWLWRTIYLSKLPGLDKKVRGAFDWTLDLLFGKDVGSVHHRPRRSDSYREEHRESTFGSNGNGGSVASADGNLKLIRSKKESVREYSAAMNGLDHHGS